MGRGGYLPMPRPIPALCPLSPPTPLPRGESGLFQVRPLSAGSVSPPLLSDERSNPTKKPPPVSKRGLLLLTSYQFLATSYSLLVTNHESRITSHGLSLPRRRVRVGGDGVAAGVGRADERHLAGGGQHERD